MADPDLPAKGKPDPLEMLAALTSIVTREAEAKTQELEVRRLEVESNEKIALATIQAKQQASEKGWDTYHALQKTRWAGAVVILVVFLFFSGWAIHAGAKELVVDLFKVFVGFSAGAFGGFHYGRAKRKQDADE